MPISQMLSVALQRRLACAGDEPLLFALFASDKRMEFAAFGVPAAQAEMLVEMQYRGRKMTYAAQFPQAEDSILVADDGTPAGRLLIDRKPDCWRIVDIAILPEHRGRGLGTRAIKECQARCAEAGAKLALQVATTSPARRLYERSGFRVSREDAVAVEMIWCACADAGISG
jgi:ribosomal protein S18 acetylase RimI-like enzyme